MAVDFQLLSYATARQAEILQAVDQYGTYRATAKALGLAHGTVADVMAALKKRAARQGYAPGHWTGGVAPGYVTGKVTVAVNAKTGEVERYWQRQHPDANQLQEMMLAAAAAMKEELPRVKAARAPAKVDESLCNLAVFSDYHIGMLAWEREGGANWDLKIAESLLLASFIHMIESAPKAKTCVLCLQGDQMHVDSLLPVTPAHHHVLDADGRFSKIVGAAVRVIRRLIDHALAKHEQVHLIICEGNHDESGSVWMRHMFAALYENEPRLTVNDSELPFYVHQHGETMLAFHHGHKVKNEQLPMLFAAQFPKVWGATTKRFAHCGHRHHVDEKEYAGMTVVQHPTLAARDAYAARGGWISERAASIITYHDKYGQVARNTVCPEMFEAA
jgi:hypothetical protein